MKLRLRASVVFSREGFHVKSVSLISILISFYLTSGIRAKLIRYHFGMRLLSAATNNPSNPTGRRFAEIDRNSLRSAATSLAIRVTAQSATASAEPYTASYKLASPFRRSHRVEASAEPRCRINLSRRVAAIW